MHLLLVNVWSGLHNTDHSIPGKRHHVPYSKKFLWIDTQNAWWREHWWIDKVNKKLVDQYQIHIRFVPYKVQLISSLGSLHGPSRLPV